MEAIMKRIIFAIVIGLGLSSLTSYAQEGNYYDDIYFSASDAATEAKEKAKKTSRETQYYQNDNQHFEEGYEEEVYLDYEEDSYTMRIRRFHRPVSYYGYYSSFYSPYWMNSYYAPYYGAYRPGISFSFGWGNYWGPSIGWGYSNPWYGYGGRSEEH